MTATTKAARATVAEAMRTTVMMVTMAATVATITPNGDKDNKDGIPHRQQCRGIIRRSKSAGKRDRQLIG